uniref:Reticulon 2b n=1 Tax=Echeneis naucrates TaxID=173247 RepID=A0A665TRB6_ECHNA
DASKTLSSKPKTEASVLIISMKNKIPHPTHQDLTGNTDDLHTVPLFCLVIGLASMFQLSAITVLSHICLGVMCVTFSLRFYYKLLELLRFNPGMHPFHLTDKDTVMLVEELVLLIAFQTSNHVLCSSSQFVILLYLLTYVGVLTNGLTLSDTFFCNPSQNNFFFFFFFSHVENAQDLGFGKCWNGTLSVGPQEEQLSSISELPCLFMGARFNRP